MNYYLGLVLLIFITSRGWAEPSPECQQLEHAKHKINAHALNWTNSDPTRTSMNLYIDRNQEYLSVSSYAQILRHEAQKCRSGAVVEDHGQSAIIRYKSGTVHFDIFNFKSDGNLVSWVRDYKGGSRTMNF